MRGVFFAPLFFAFAQDRSAYYQFKPQAYRDKKSALYKSREKYIRSSQTSPEWRESRQAIADDVSKITTQDDVLKLLGGWSEETIKAIMPVFF